MDKAELFKPYLPEAEVEIPGLGTVRVRAMSRAEVMMLQDTKGVAAVERKMLHFAMVDPVLTEAEAGDWQKATIPSVIEPVTAKIAELSGMNGGSSDKETYKSVRRESGDGVRVLPSPEVGDDGSQAPDGTD
jgi:hypothetical protein